MSKYWSELTRKISPYVPGEQPKDKKYIKINTNENPYPPSPKAIAAMQGAAGDALKLYPDPSCTELKNTIAEYFNLKSNQIFVGNGSDEILAFGFMAFFNPSDPILFPDISYSFYPVYAKLFNIDYIKVPLEDDFTIPVSKFCRVNGGVIFPNPNAPTGVCMSIANIEEVLKANSEKVVIIDEAYIDFGGESALKLINSYPNLLVVQTLSKSRSLAGLRIGYAAGNKELIDGLVRIKNSFNSYTVDRLAIAGSIEAIEDTDYFEEIRLKVIKTRERIKAELVKIGFNVTDSKANFLFVSHNKVNAEVIFRELKEKGILVRYFKLPRIDNNLRISIGTDKDMDIFIEALKMVLIKHADMSPE